MVVGEIREERDLVIIGAGPGGYTAAIRAAQLGLQVALVEEANLGGQCLNQACIPSKIWVTAAKKRSELSQLGELGLEIKATPLNLERLQTYKEKVMAQLRQGVEALCQANKVEVIQGKATFIADDRLGVELGHQFDTYVFKQAIIATGSSPLLPKKIREADSLPKDSRRILVDQQLFNLTELPEQLIIYGHDYIALEVAFCFNALGSKVSLLMDEGASFPFDLSIQKELQRQLKKNKIKLIKLTSIQSVEETEHGISVSMSTEKEAKQIIDATYFFVSGERVPNVNDLGINRFGVEQTDQGFIKVNKHMQTTNPAIYAIGDVTVGPLLAVKAIKQGKVAAEAIAGGHQELDLTFLPSIAHTIPPLASVGLTETEAEAYGFKIKVSQFPMGSNGFALVTGKRDGFVKVISDANNDLILGIHMLGEGAIELSSTFVQALEMAAKTEDMLFPNYAHPSINEALLEAIEGLSGQAIHLPPSK